MGGMVAHAGGADADAASHDSDRSEKFRLRGGTRSEPLLLGVSKARDVWESTEDYGDCCDENHSGGIGNCGARSSILGRRCP